MLSRATKALLPVTAMAAALTLTLAGCSSGSKAPTEYEEGPLSKYLSALWDGEEWNEEKFQEDSLRTEELIAECMQKEGFEYTPDTQNSGMMVSSDDTDGPEWGSKEFAEQYGYGFQDSPGMTGGDDDNQQEWTDPNADYVASLSESEQQAFYETLHGPGPTDEEFAQMEEDEDYSFSQDLSEQGCWGKAYAEVNAGQDNYTAASEDPEFADLFEGIDAVWNTEDNDEMIKLNGEWAACMADSGYAELKTPSDAHTLVMEELNSLYSSGDLEDPEDYQEPSEKDLAAAKAKEIEIATADFACNDKLDYMKKSTQIMHDEEQRFVDANKAKLDAMLAKYQVSGAAKSEEK